MRYTEVDDKSVASVNDHDRLRSDRRENRRLDVRLLLRGGPYDVVSVTRLTLSQYRYDAVQSRQTDTGTETIRSVGGRW